MNAPNLSFSLSHTHTLTHIHSQIRAPLFILAVKSLRAVSQDTAVIDAKGLRHDRAFMLVVPAPLPIYGSFASADATHRFVTQRQCPLLATVTAKLDSRTDTLTLATTTSTTSTSTTAGTGQTGSPIAPTVTLSTVPAATAPYYKASLWSDTVVVRDMGDAAAAFFQNVLHWQHNKDTAHDPAAAASTANTAGVRLVRQAATDGRQAAAEHVPAAARTYAGANPAVSLQDGFPVLIACQASLDELNRRLKQNSKAVLPMARFRPNIVVTGTRPFEEDSWKVISIGGAVFHVVKNCPRCKQSCTDQNTGEVTAEPLETLAEFRALDPDNAHNCYFAQNAIPATGSVGQTIAVGATVKVLQRGTPVWGD